MSKLKFLFCIALIASATQAAAGRYTILEAAQDYIDDNLKALQKTADKFQNAAEEALESTKGKITEMETRIKESTDDLIDHMQNVLAAGSDRDVDVEECRKYMPQEAIEYLGEELLHRTKVCIDRYAESNDQIKNMAIKAKNVLVLLNNIKLEAEECIENVSGRFKTIKITRCIASAELKAKWEVTKRLPNIIRDQVKLATKLHGLPEKVANCLTEDNLERFERPIEQNLTKVGLCVTSLVEKNKPKVDNSENSIAQNQR